LPFRFTSRHITAAIPKTRKNRQETLDSPVSFQKCLENAFG
jgi:hypothetical protein